jgi:hypothetical protein
LSLVDLTGGLSPKDRDSSPKDLTLSLSKGEVRRHGPNQRVTKGKTAG